VLRADELGNIKAAQAQGTCSVHCEDGVTLDTLHQGCGAHAGLCARGLGLTRAVCRIEEYAMRAAYSKRNKK